MTVPNYIDGNKNNLRTTEAQTVQKLKNNESAKIYWFCKKKSVVILEQHRLMATPGMTPAHLMRKH